MNPASKPFEDGYMIRSINTIVKLHQFHQVDKLRVHSAPFRNFEFATNN